MAALLPTLNRCERWLVEYWNSKRSDDQAPHRRAIDPLEMWQYLPFLQIHALTESDRLLCRLSGTEVVKATRLDQTGQYLDEVITEAAYARRKQLFDRCLLAGRPLLYRAHVALPGLDWRIYRRLMLPLRYRSERPDMVLSRLEFERGAEPTRLDASSRADILEHHEMGMAELATLAEMPSPPPAKRAC
jgi:hypothetical protein